MIRYIPLIWKNGLRNRRRSALTIGSIAVSLCILGLLMALYRGLFLAGPATPGQALRLVTHHKVSMTNPMPGSYEERIRHVPGVREVQIWQWVGGGLQKDPRPTNFLFRDALAAGQPLTGL